MADVCRSLGSPKSALYAEPPRSLGSLNRCLSLAWSGHGMDGNQGMNLWEFTNLNRTVISWPMLAIWLRLGSPLYNYWKNILHHRKSGFGRWFSEWRLPFLGSIGNLLCFLQRFAHGFEVHVPSASIQMSTGETAEDWPYQVEVLDNRGFPWYVPWINRVFSTDYWCYPSFCWVGGHREREIDR